MTIAAANTVHLFGAPLPSESSESDDAKLLPASSLMGRRFMLCTGQIVTFDHLDDYPDSHILGELRPTKDDGVDIIVLAMYETSLPVNDPPVVLPLVRAEIIGDVRRIKCTCCIHRSRWGMKKKTFLALSRYRKLRKL